MNWWIAIRMTIVMTVLTGIAYPLAITGVGNLLFPYQAQGSLILRNGQVTGSELIGQNFSLPKYFHGRPSAAGDQGYDADSSGGSNLAPTNRKLIDTVRQRVKNLREQNPSSGTAQVPVDLVTASGSGLDPEITPAAADLQAPEVAKARGLSETAVRALVRRHTRPRWAGVMGEPGVNVLELNLALDNLTATNPAGMNQNRAALSDPPATR